MYPADHVGDVENSVKQSGLIAQDILQIEELKHVVLVPETEEDPYGVDYQQLHAYECNDSRTPLESSTTRGGKHRAQEYNRGHHSRLDALNA